MISKSTVISLGLYFVWYQALYYGIRMGMIFFNGIRTRAVTWRGFVDKSISRSVSHEQDPEQFNDLLFRSFSISFIVIYCLVLVLLLQLDLLKATGFLLLGGGGLFLFSVGMRMLLKGGGFHRIWPSEYGNVKKEWITREHPKFRDIIYGLYLGMGLLSVFFGLILISSKV